MDKILAGQLAAPLGPFLLGLCCEYFLVRSKSVWPGVVFHAACNSTAAVFLIIDPRWLDCLGILYLG